MKLNRGRASGSAPGLADTVLQNNNLSYKKGVFVIHESELSYEERLLLEKYRQLNEKGKELLLKQANINLEFLSKKIVEFPNPNHAL